MYLNLNIETSKCPSCKVDLEKIPQRKAKCPHCSEVIYKRTNPESESLILVSEQYIEKVDEENCKFYELRDFIKNWKEIIFNDLKLSLEEYEKIKLQSGSPFEKDHLFTALDLLKQKHFLSNELRKVARIYSLMASFVSSEGKNPFQFFQRSIEYELLEMKKSQDFFDKVKIVCSRNGCCEECEKINGKIYSIDEALREMPIPNKNCTRISESDFPFCICSWIFVI